MNYAMSLHQLSIASIPRQKNAKKKKMNMKSYPLVDFDISIHASTGEGVHLNLGQLDLH